MTQQYAESQIRAFDAHAFREAMGIESQTTASDVAAMERVLISIHGPRNIPRSVLKDLIVGFGAAGVGEEAVRVANELLAHPNLEYADLVVLAYVFRCAGDSRRALQFAVRYALHPDCESSLDEVVLGEFGSGDHCEPQVCIALMDGIDVLPDRNQALVELVDWLSACGCSTAVPDPLRIEILRLNPDPHDREALGALAIVRKHWGRLVEAREGFEKYLLRVDETEQEWSPLWLDYFEILLRMDPVQSVHRKFRSYSFSCYKGDRTWNSLWLQLAAKYLEAGMSEVARGLITDVLGSGTFNRTRDMAQEAIGLLKLSYRQAGISDYIAVCDEWHAKLAGAQESTHD